MARSTNDAIVSVSISSKSQVMANKILDAIRGMPEYAADDAEIQVDNRRGGYSIRYEPFVFHLNP